MFIDVQVNFNVEQDGLVYALDARGWADAGKPLYQQAAAIADDCIERHNRIRGTSWRRRVVLSVFWRDSSGYWYCPEAVDADGAGITW